MNENKDTRLPPHLSDIQREIEGYARGFGLDFYETIFEVLGYDEINMVAAYGGFPNRYPHWRFGMEYERLRKQHFYGLGRIYEMVINNDPCYAYLQESNALVDQKLVTDELVEERFADATAPGAQAAMASMGMSFWNPETAEDGMLWREAHRLGKHTLLTWGREDRVNPVDGAFLGLKLIIEMGLRARPEVRLEGDAGRHGREVAQPLCPHFAGCRAAAGTAISSAPTNAAAARATVSGPTSPASRC